MPFTAIHPVFSNKIFLYHFTNRVATKIILNPVHDKMTRFEMKLKRRFLPKNNRLVISVWNKEKFQLSGDHITFYFVAE